MIRPATELRLRHGVNLMTTRVPSESTLKVGRKVRLRGDDTRLWLIEHLYPSGESDFEPKEYLGHCGFGYPY